MTKGVGLVIVAAALIGVLAARVEAVEDGSLVKVSAEVAASLQNTPERIHRRVLLQDNEQIETDVPGTPSRTYCTAYRVKFGDTLHFIALKTGSRVRTLIALNPSLIVRPLFVGEVIAVPPCFTISFGPGGEEEEEVGVDASDVAEDDVEDLEDIEALAPSAEEDVDLEEIVEEILDVDGPALAPSSE